MTNWIVEKLDKNLHDRNKFSCGVHVLDEYLKTRANKEQKNHLNVTFVATFSSKSGSLKPIGGYYTLSNSSIKLDSIPPNLQKGVPLSYDIPSIKIGRLAVDQAYQGNGVGKLLLKNASLKIIEAAVITGVKCVEVVAKDNQAAKFYEKFGFVRLKDHNHLILHIDTLIKASA